MLEIKKQELEKVALVGVITPKVSREIVIDHLNELNLLCDTAGAKVEKIFYQNIPNINPAYFIGKGKAQEIAEYVAENNISAIIFDDDLSPTQVRNLENLTNCKVLDRSAVILDIFASHAKTSEAKTQVELAQYEYFLPRLTRAWTHLSKQYGGIGTKGPGETQIETDRRIIRNKIFSLKKKLELIDIQRDTQRKNRQELFKVVLVGYTNVGKSTILNHLTDASVLVEDKLFATLDSTTRLIQTKDGNKFLLSDTVGFIRKLPHSLIASFRSTLKEIVDADLILHIADISHPNYEEQINVVNETLAEIKADRKEIQLVFNKIDLLEDSNEIDRCIKSYPNAVFISAERGININELEEKINKAISTFIVAVDFEINHNQNKLLSSIRQLSESLQTKYLEDKIQIKLTARQSNLTKIKKLLSNYAQ